MPAWMGPSGRVARSAALNVARHVLLLTVAGLLRLPRVAVVPEPGPWSVRSELVLAMLSCGPPRTMWVWSTTVTAFAEKLLQRFVADSATVVPSAALNVARELGSVGRGATVPLAVNGPAREATAAPASSSSTVRSPAGAVPPIVKGVAPVRGSVDPREGSLTVTSATVIAAGPTRTTSPGRISGVKRVQHVTGLGPPALPMTMPLRSSWIGPATSVATVDRLRFVVIAACAGTAVAAAVSTAAQSPRNADLDGRARGTS